MQLVWAAVNRPTYEGKVAGPQHRVPLDAALKAMTIEAAYSIQQENRVGSIELGKDANLTVLSQSPYEVEPARLKDIAVWGTMLEGRMQPVATAPIARSSDRAPSGVVAGNDREVQRAVVGQLAKLIGQRHAD